MEGERCSNEVGSGEALMPERNAAAAGCVEGDVVVFVLPFQKQKIFMMYVQFN